MRTLKPFFILTLLFSFTTIFQSCYQDAKAVNNNEIKVENFKWHSINDLATLQQKNPKKVLIDIYTDWCKWCKVMDEQTFGDEALRNYLKEEFYLIKLNAEDKNAIQFKGKEYKFVASGRRGYNTLAAELLEGKMAYPSLVVLDKELNILDVMKGFKDATTLKKDLSKLPL